jgi:Domain of unknown function (DUF4157)
MLHLQRTAGNHATQRAVQRMMSARSSSASVPGGIHRENEASSHEATAKPEAGAKQLSISKPQILTRNAPAGHSAGSQTAAPVSTESPSLGGTGETSGGNGTAVPPWGNNNGQPQLPPSLRRFFDSRQDHDLGGARVYQDKPAAPPLDKHVPLTVNEPGDRFEREADAVAEHVMRTPLSAPNRDGKGLSSGDGENKLQRQPSERAPEFSMQRKCSHCEAEEEQKIVQPQLSGGTAQVSGIQRKCAQCDEEEEMRRKLQRHSTDAAPGVAPPIVHQVLNTPGRPLDGSTRSFMEQRFGHDFSGVRIHTDERAAESAQSVNALAYTVGHDIVFGAGQYAPTLPAGQKLLAHELTHVVQQGARPLSSSQSPISQLSSSVATLSKSILQRQPPGMSTVYTEGSVPHNHRPSGRWGDVQANPNSAFPINVACSLLSPRQVVDVAIWREFSDKPTALRHLRWYLNAGGADFNENENIDRWVRADERFRRTFDASRHGQLRGFMEVQQGFFGNEDFRFSFGTIDRMDYEVDEIAGTIHLWFKDRYEYHPVYPFYSHFPDDEPRDTNCVHAALVELKSQGAADFWMIGEGTFPLRLFAFSPQEIMV